ncbi:MAG: hypothetical protein A2315_11395 [Ignavibacteria bacterium RIFOXYB2_FULL_35_12]|nr:MAG: hypothetical protein A2058_16690 [Ignavibacteria bacterium GWA2_36_19]OGU53379.1 MAG: hypothetical protein A2006_04100 [Ignavibacteria bacterium GWC2_35_8]OGU58094.1 MAG: hypothetical protein A2X60_03285 [Ignavibacteria bacterium GWF2_35_20]OGU80013.1 MAG: hypothetical protein A2254_16795 [Ignavibacteria bacterium RIFOXYA2_FULL_35_9]OGU87560.1 MAG: hypothetical protein A2492_08080 [Ignavibacteria bacterium RIFOXYC12_FULL_35_11]OGU90205.1 MAG: hypothetical protein A3K31_10320 [Ignavibac
MFNRTVYLISSILFLFAFMSCQESTNEPEIINGGINILQHDRAGTVDVEGIVYKDSNPVNGATVKLYKGSNYLAQTTTDNYGYYIINVCGQGQGAGTYTINATKYIREEEWCDSDNFYWDGDTDPELFVIDLYLIHNEQK